MLLDLTMDFNKSELPVIFNYLNVNAFASFDILSGSFSLNVH